MDGQLAIENNREALKRILLALVAMAGLRGQFTLFPQKGCDKSELAPAEKSKLSPAPTLPRRLHRAVLRLLRPAEAAARRLIIALAMAATPQARKTENTSAPPPRRPVPVAPQTRRHMPKMPPEPPAPRIVRSLSLSLVDPLPPWSPRIKRPIHTPRICVPGYTQRLPVPLRLAPSPGDLIDARRLTLRLEALAQALDDLSRQAMRFVRWRARQKGPYERGKFRRVSPLRPGPPPGARSRPAHEVHDVLSHAHALAWWALEHPDTS